GAADRVDAVLRVVVLVPAGPGPAGPVRRLAADGRHRAGEGGGAGAGRAGGAAGPDGGAAGADGGGPAGAGARGDEPAADPATGEQGAAGEEQNLSPPAPLPEAGRGEEDTGGGSNCAHGGCLVPTPAS